MFFVGCWKTPPTSSHPALDIEKVREFIITKPILQETLKQKDKMI